MIGILNVLIYDISTSFILLVKYFILLVNTNSPCMLFHYTLIQEIVSNFIHEIGCILSTKWYVVSKTQICISSD
jgi:hypothetical protein